ncbi:MAG TPA: cytochrome c biogenesis protein CcsA [Gaiellaceae bacterium]|nr:cytochrome c biogenesis protein CcsA [Gaiellaceae bacterium]
MVELLFWPALVAYGEAAVAYAGQVRRPGLFGPQAIWGVRIGWLAQTALLVVQAARADGFPWSSWGGALNLFVWLVVSAYLVYGSRPRFGLLGLAVMPAAAALLALAYAGGGIGDRGDHPGTLLALHVVFMLGAFAGLTVAAGLAAFYLWHQRRLKRHEPRILRRAVPPLESLEHVTARTVAVSLAVLTAGIAFGLARLAALDRGLDAAMVASFVVWALYGGAVVARLHGRRLARVTLLGFAVVVLVLPITHFA